MDGVDVISLSFHSKKLREYLTKMCFSIFVWDRLPGEALGGARIIRAFLRKVIAKYYDK